MLNAGGLPSGETSNQSSANAAPRWESALLQAHEELTKRWQLRIGPARTAVMRVLLDNLQNGTRTAIVSQGEIARSCSFHPSYVRRLLRRLDRDDHLVQRVKRQGVSMYCLSRALLPDYVPDAPRPERIPPRGPLLGDNLVQIQTDTPVSVSSPDRYSSSGLTDTPVAVRSFRTKGTRALGRKVGGYSETNFLSTYLSANEEEETVLGALQTYATVNQAGAKKLIGDWRELRPDVTTDEIVHFIHLKATVTNRFKVESLGNVLVCSAEQYSGLDLNLYRKQQQRRQQQSEEREREAQKQQRRVAEREQQEFEHRQAAKAAFAKLPAEEQAAFLERTKRRLLREYPQMRHWKDFEQRIEMAAERDWLQEWPAKTDTSAQRPLASFS
jgi:hypothetical protein